jgi:alcohol dehydrogenase class IV
MVDRISERLNNSGIAVTVIDSVLSEPTAANITEIHRQTAGENYDVLMGFGGGSVMDATKLVAVLRTNSLKVEEMLGVNLVAKPGIPTVLIPTTAGTGSEATPNAIVTLPEQELKVGVVSRYLLPALVLIDPLVTVGLPPFVTAFTGMDAFIHSFESFISTKANPLSDLFALEGMRLVSRNILLAYRQADNLQAREAMMLGALYGGMAITAAGTAAVHALAYPLGGKFNIPHGVSNSMLLPHVTEFNADAIQPSMAEVAKAMGVHGDGSTAGAAVIGCIQEWIADLGIPQNLADYGVEEKDIDGLARAALKVTRLLVNNPKVLSHQDIAGIYRRLLPTNKSMVAASN